MKTKIFLNIQVYLMIIVFFVCLSCETSDVQKIGELPAVTNHLDQSSIDQGELSLEEIIQHGKELFVISFNTLDGAGRPEATGSNKKRLRSTDAMFLITTIMKQYFLKTVSLFMPTKF